METLARKIDRFNLGGETPQLIARAGEILIPELDHILGDFYNRALADPEARSFFENDARVTSARNAQKKHWMRLLSGDFGEGYAASVDRIGRTHARINLPLDVYMSAYALSSGEMLGTPGEGRPRRVGSAASGDASASGGRRQPGRSPSTSNW
jgi:methyl-accepting chemotaxis protein